MEGTKRRIKPIVNVKADYDHEHSIYPEHLRVAMEDGKVIKYQLETELPHPAFLFAMSLLKKMPKGSYQYKEKHWHL